jgi:hypothetical protein
MSNSPNPKISYPTLLEFVELLAAVGDEAQLRDPVNIPLIFTDGFDEFCVTEVYVSAGVPLSIVVELERTWKPDIQDNQEAWEDIDD